MQSLRSWLPWAGLLAVPTLVHAQTIDPYDDSFVHDLVIEFPDNPNWHLELVETWMCRLGYSGPCADCATAPQYVDGAVITFDGIEVSGEVRYRGYSSFSAGLSAAGYSSNSACDSQCQTPHWFTGGGCKLPFAIKLDDRIGGVEHFDLNNLVVDQSQLKDSLGRRMIGHVATGNRVSYTRVWIGPADDGTLLDLGLYVNLEHLDAEFVERRTLSQDGWRYNWNGPQSANCATIRPEGGDTSLPCLEQLATIVDIQDTLGTFTPNSAGFEEALDGLIDVDNFVWYLALWSVLGDSDGEQSESFQDTSHGSLNASGLVSGRLQILAKDVDHSFLTETQPIDGVGQGPMVSAFRDTLLEDDGIHLRYEHHLRHLLATDFREDVLQCWGETTGELIVPELDAATLVANWLSPLFPGYEAHNEQLFAERLDGLIDYVGARRAYLFSIAELLLAGPPITKVSQLPNPVTPVPVTVKAKVESDTIDSVSLLWRTQGGFQRVAMTEVSTYIYEATIPAQAALTRVEYYVEAIHTEGSGQSASYSPARAAQAPYSYLVAADWSDSPIVLNEVSAKGLDWVELHNPSNATVDLTGYRLSDGLTPVGAFEFTSDLALEYRTIPAGGFLLVYCDEVVGGTPLITDFGLSADGERLTLYDASLALVDHYHFGRSFSLMSRGRRFDGDYEWVERVQPTPGASNAVFGDFNGDGVVAQADLSYLLGVYGTTCCLPCPADLNEDGVVNTADMLLLLAQF